MIFFQSNPTGILSDHRLSLEDFESSLKPLGFIGDDNQSDEELEYDYPHLSHNEPIWPQYLSKRYTPKLTRGGSPGGNGGDSRLWAIPYRFGKRAAMPYRFGKRAGMHFRLGKKSASL